MAAGGEIKDLCHEATCPICLEYFKDPVTIAECGHNFCQACLTQCWGEEEGGAAAAFCPQCRRTVQQRRNLIPNRQLANFVEIAKKLRLRGQTRTSEAEPLCEKHQEPLNFFCKDQETPICVVCDRSKEHESHTVIPREEAVQEYQDQICSSIKILRAEREKILTYKTDLKKESQDLLKQTEEERQKTLAEFRQIHQFLEEQEKNLLSQIGLVEKEIARRRGEPLARLSKELSSLENIIREMEEKSQQPASDFLQDIRRTLQRYEKREIFVNPVAFPPELTCRIREFRDRKSRLEDVMEQFQGQARRSHWSTAAGRSAWVPSGVPANVTLDPDTAHPKLILSEDCKSVRRGDKCQALPNNPERFANYTVVLGREGFTAGRHFWDVIVPVGSQGSWAVGVARKSVRRKGLGVWGGLGVRGLSPQQGIWAVGNRGGTYGALCSPDLIPLSLSQEPKRIRVTLSYAEGQVVFSDADTGAYYYTYSGALFCGETLLPFFQVCDKAHLTLSP